MGQRCNAVFEGGGVKGIGFVGAVCEAERRGYKFENVAGTSAGAIVASLIAAGYKGGEIGEIMRNFDFSKLRECGRLSSFGLVGKGISLLVNYGIYNTEYFESWLNELLSKKNIQNFGDIRTGSSDEKFKYRFKAIASDLTDKRMLILPDDLKDFGIDPDKFNIATAVRMSMSIPLYFKPYCLYNPDGLEHIITDGGMLSNYPIWLLDNGTSMPEWPTFGFKFSNHNYNYECTEPVNNIIDYGKSVLTTMLEANDNYHISTAKGDSARTIFIPTIISDGERTKNIKTTYFDIHIDEKNALSQNGEAAASKFFKTWDFNRWKTTYRKGA